MDTAKDLDLHGGAAKSGHSRAIVLSSGPVTSRERILHALRHEPADRLPIDLGGTRQSGIAALAYARLRRHSGLT